MHNKSKTILVVTLAAVTLVASCATTETVNPSKKFAGSKSSVFSQNSKAARGDDGGSDR